MISERYGDGRKTLDHMTDFRSCTFKDFPFLNISESEYIQNRFCPDVDQMKDLVYLKNHYSNNTERISFKVEFLKCYGLSKTRCKNTS